MSEICREKTLLEEIKDLEIEETTKKRLVNKCEKLLRDLEQERLWRSNSNHYNLLADTRIQMLEQTIANMCVKQFGKSEWQYDNSEEGAENDD